MNPVHLRRVGLAVTVVALLMGTMAPAIATPVDGTRPVTSTSIPRGSSSTSFPWPSSTWHQLSTTMPHTSSTFLSSTTSIPHTSSTLPETTTTVPETTTTVPETTTTEPQTTTTVAETTTTDPESTTTSQVTSTTAPVTTTSAAEGPSATAPVDPAQQTTTTVATPSTLPFTGGGPGQTVALVAGALLLTGIGLVVASRRGEDPSSKAWIGSSAD